MSTKEAYEQKIKAELELVQAKVAELKAHAKNYKADAGITYAKQVDELEQRIDATKAKLKQLGEASEDAWEQLKDGMERARDGLSAAVRAAQNTFKE